MRHEHTGSASEANEANEGGQGCPSDASHAEPVSRINPAGSIVGQRPPFRLTPINRLAPPSRLRTR
jgi:hypothetical protein